MVIQNVIYTFFFTFIHRLKVVTPTLRITQTMHVQATRSVSSVDPSPATPTVLPMTSSSHCDQTLKVVEMELKLEGKLNMVRIKLNFRITINNLRKKHRS